MADGGNKDARMPDLMARKEDIETAWWRDRLWEAGGVEADAAEIRAPHLRDSDDEVDGALKRSK